MSTTVYTKFSIPWSKVFAIPELLASIMATAERSTCATAALVCKAWSGPAKDEIWKELPRANPLFQLLAPLNSSQSSFTTWVHTFDWKTFEEIAPRVRSLKINENDSQLYSVGSSAMAAVAVSRTTLHFLPSLQSLDLEFESTDMLCHAVMFLFPTLTNLKLRLGGGISDETIVYAMKHLRLIPKLRHVQLYRCMTDVASLEATLDALSTLSHLETLKIDGSIAVFQAALSRLCSLPRLEALSFALRNDIIIETSSTPKVPEDNVFALKKLDIRGIDRVQLYTLMVDYRFPFLHGFELSVPESQGEGPDTVGLLSEVSNLFPGLAHFSWVCEGGEDASPRRFGEILSTNISFPLTTLRIGHSVPLQLTLPDVAQIAAALGPTIETLYLNPAPKYTWKHQDDTRLDLSVFVPFAQHCRKLKELAVYFDAGIVVRPAEQLPKFSSTLEQINVGTSPIGSLPHVLEYLIATGCPAIKTDGEQPPASWNVIQAALGLVNGEMWPTSRNVLRNVLDHVSQRPVGFSLATKSPLKLTSDREVVPTVQDILPLALKYAEPRVCFQAALVCRAWYEPASAALWSVVPNPRPLYRLLARMDPSYSSDRFAEVIPPEGWEAFLKAAARIEHLTINDYAEVLHQVHFSVFRDTAALNPVQNAAPALRSLSIQSSSRHKRLVGFSIFLVPNLKKLELDLSELYSSDLARAVSYIPRASNLTELKLNQCLTTSASLTATAGVLRRLTELTKLEFNIPANDLLWFFRNLANHRKLEHIIASSSGSYETPELPEVTVDEDAFPALHTLSFRQFPSANLETLLLDYDFSKVRNFVLDESVVDLERVASALPRRMPLLSSIALGFKVEGEDRQPLTNLWAMLEPMLTLKHLTSLSITHNRPLDLSVQDISRIARKLGPSIETLVLNPFPSKSWTGSQNRLGLSALLPFVQHCKRMKKLALYIDGSQVPPDSPLELPKFPSTFQEIDFGTSRIQHIGPVVAFLAGLGCPSIAVAADTKSENKEPTQWSPAAKLLDLLRGTSWKYLRDVEGRGLMKESC